MSSSRGRRLPATNRQRCRRVGAGSASRTVGLRRGLRGRDGLFHKLVRVERKIQTELRGRPVDPEHNLKPPRNRGAARAVTDSRLTNNRWARLERNQAEREVRTLSAGALNAIGRRGVRNRKRALSRG